MYLALIQYNLTTIELILPPAGQYFSAALAKLTHPFCRQQFDRLLNRSVYLEFQTISLLTPFLFLVLPKVFALNPYKVFPTFSLSPTNILSSVNDLRCHSAKPVLSTSGVLPATLVL